MAKFNLRQKRRQMTQARRNKMRAGAKKGFAARVKSVVKRLEETKYVANDLASTGVAHDPVYYVLPTMTNTGSAIPAIPALEQGVADYQRIGNKISPTSLKVDLQIGLNPTDLSANSLIGVIYYGTSKESKTWVGGSPLSTINFLDRGDGTNSSWGGARSQLNMPPDNTLVSIKRITFSLSKSAGSQNGDHTTLQGNLATSNGLSYRTFTLGFKPPKTLIYNKETDDYPTNYAPWYYIGFCHADGSQANNIQDDTRMNVSSRAHMRFKDA